MGAAWDLICGTSCFYNSKTEKVIGGGGQVYHSAQLMRSSFYNSALYAAVNHIQLTKSFGVFTSLSVEKEPNPNKYLLQIFLDSEFKIGETHHINSLNVLISLVGPWKWWSRLHVWNSEVSNIVCDFLKKGTKLEDQANQLNII